MIAASLLALSGATYLILSRKKEIPEPVPGETPVVDETGEEISVEQQKVPANLVNILALSAANATTALKGKTIYTKVPDVRTRLEPKVNNGIIDNIVGKISNAGTVVGKVTQVVDDVEGAKNSSGRVYKWLRVDAPSQDAIKQMEDNASFLSGFSKNRIIYLREDVVKI